jgi:hypothetical protein
MQSACGLPWTGQEPLLDICMLWIVDLKEIGPRVSIALKVLTRGFFSVIDQVSQRAPVFIRKREYEGVVEAIYGVTYMLHQIDEGMLVPMKAMREDLIVFSKETIFSLIKLSAEFKELLEPLILSPLTHPRIRRLTVFQ